MSTTTISSNHATLTPDSELKTTYVDGWVMWPAAVFPLLGLSQAPVPAT
jgi:hypothetical protein